MDRVAMGAEGRLAFVLSVPMELIVGVGEYGCAGLWCGDFFDPEGVYYSACSAVRQGRAVPLKALFLRNSLDLLESPLELLRVDRLKLLFRHQRRHRINVVADHGRATFGGFYKG